jgi:hypothetical protein
LIPDDDDLAPSPALRDDAVFHLVRKTFSGGNGCRSESVSIGFGGFAFNVSKGKAPNLKIERRSYAAAPGAWHGTHPALSYFKVLSSDFS